MRVSVCNWATGEEDVRVAAESVLKALRKVEGIDGAA